MIVYPDAVSEGERSSAFLRLSSVNLTTFADIIETDTISPEVLLFQLDQSVNLTLTILVFMYAELVQFIYENFLVQIRSVAMSLSVSRIIFSSCIFVTK